MTGSSKKRIAMIGQKRVPSLEGGVEVVVWELSRRLYADGYDVDCYNRKEKHAVNDGKAKIEGKRGFYNEGIRIITVPTVSDTRLNAIIYSFFAAIRALFGRYDVIHFHAEGPCLMLWLPKLFGIRCVATIHGLDWQRAKWGNFASKMLRTGEKIAAKQADEVIVLSKNVQEYFMKEYGRKTRYIANGISRPSLYEPDVITREYGLGKRDYILSLSRIVPEKGIEYLIEAFKNTKTDKKLVIAGGPGTTMDYFVKIQKLAAEDPRIIMTGFVEGRCREELFSNTCLYVLPSDIEGMAISLLEAMSYGNACLVSDIDENVEAVEDKAMTFKKSDVSDLRDKLEYALDHDEVLEGYRKEAADFICGRYNWDVMTKETEKLYADHS